MKTNLATQIRNLPIAERRQSKAMSHRLRSAIQRMREHLCARLGVASDRLTDEHVALFAQKAAPDFSYMYHHFYGVGFTTTRQLIAWAKKQGK